MHDSLLSLIDWLFLYKVNIVFSILLIIFYLVFRSIINPKIEQYIARDHLKSETLKSAILSLNLFSGAVVFVLILFVWGFDFRGLLAFSTGLIAITGVALFASWSLLSNITAFFILLVHQSYRRGNFIRVMDMDNYIEGYLSEINLFNTKLITENREIIIYPNNLLIARPIVVNPKKRYSGVGKVQEFLEDSDRLIE